PQPLKHTPQPRKTAATGGAGSTPIEYCGIAVRPVCASGITTAADTPNNTPPIIKGIARTPAMINPFCPSSGVREERAIWKAACARITLTKNVPNHTMITCSPAFVISNMSGEAAAKVFSPSTPGLIKKATAPMTNIIENKLILIVCVKAIDHLPPACKYTNNKIAVKATEKVNEKPVNTWMAGAKAIAVATEHIGKANAVIGSDIPFDARPNLSTIK